VTVLNMDCIEGMRLFPDAFFDSIVTDPPYELGFMGKTWDATGIAYSVEMWREALRVLKPGGHLLAFSGSRTYHRMVCAIEDAGFEIRDQIMWVYGSGFPKSLDVSKAIDKARTEDREPVRVICRAVRAAMESRGMKSGNLVSAFGDCDPRLIDHWAARDTDSQPSLPKPEQWSVLRELFPELLMHDADVARLNGRKGTHGEAWQTAEVVGERTTGIGTGKGSTAFIGDGEMALKAPATDAARQWQGWGTALKPAHEPIVVARKPLIGTVAANVLAHGTGAINVDGCRVDGGTRPHRLNNGERDEKGFGNKGSGIAAGDTTLGRWPANLIHDGSDEVLAAFPQDAGRFFYCAKASKADRGEGNTHPTVKPTDLMRYLCRLVTPPGGTVLDPFTGSGSTGKAARLEGFGFIGFELSAEYAAIATARIMGAAR
jgi:DNA modification methylase